MQKQDTIAKKGVHFMIQQIELLPGVQSEPLFETEEAYQAWRESYIEEVGPILLEFDKKRARSEHQFLMRPPFK